ncbi:MAG: hypothetical protein DRR08_12650 [Candidatus Parabeggiatoa sp. nov. 2]|nr:MAG: hypothetical protein B6247_15200 [Beggiatoa sp. 4572_84]RKZ59931.1 MAG: hypothetical protein DRR08_12650 [Gammaproteobacteria bacterium]HEC83813.1 hypothetical protein [Thioploca sp.]
MRFFLQNTVLSLNFKKHILFNELSFGTLTGYVHQHLLRQIIVRHPLWQDEHPDWLTAKAKAQTQHPDYDLDFYPWQV